MNWDVPSEDALFQENQSMGHTRVLMQSSDLA